MAGGREGGNKKEKGKEKVQNATLNLKEMIFEKKWLNVLREIRRTNN